VLDCGAAPGAWSQVAVQRVNATGTGRASMLQPGPLVPVGLGMPASRPSWGPKTSSHFVQALACVLW
jgi:hypothetical protein